MSEKKHEIVFDRDAHGWVASCACGWKRFTFSKKAANVCADDHMGYPVEPFSPLKG